MDRNFETMIARAARAGNAPWIALAQPGDPAILEAVREALRLGLARFQLIGRPGRIPFRPDPGSLRVIDAPDEARGLEIAAERIRAGEAAILMKGSGSSKALLGAVLARKEWMLRAPLLSHLAALEVPGREGIVFMTDGGINIDPDLGRKREIVQNAVHAMIRLGIRKPRAALLAAVETVDPKMPATTDAALLRVMAERGQIRGAWVDGPMALDIAVGRAAASIKRVSGPVAGRADLLVVPSIESGNILAKTLTHLSGATMAGVILGASVPIVMTSRSDTARGRLASIALAVLMAARPAGGKRGKGA